MRLQLLGRTEHPDEGVRSLSLSVGEVVTLFELRLWGISGLGHLLLLPALGLLRETLGRVVELHLLRGELPPRGAHVRVRAYLPKRHGPPPTTRAPHTGTRRWPWCCGRRRPRRRTRGGTAHTPG